VALLALSASSAFAVKTHPFTGTSFGPEGAAGGEATFSDVEGVAVEQSSHDVFVYDAGAGKIYKFDSAGEPVNFSQSGTNAIGGVGGAGAGENQIAIAPPGSPAGTAGDIYVANIAGVSTYAPSGEKLGEIAGAGEEVCGVATNSAGHVFVGIYNGEQSQVREYTPTANPFTSGDQSGASNPILPETCNIAVDGLGNLYGASYNGSSGVVKLEGLGDSSASPVDPSSQTLAIDPSDNNVYADRRNLVAQYDSAGTLLETLGGEQLSESHGLAVDASSGVVYVGVGRKVDVFGPSTVLPGVTAEPAGNVTGVSATLNAAVNPDSLAVGDCKFEYGTTSAYGLVEPCEGSIPADGSDHSVTAALTALTPGAAYHWRIVATNVNGTNRSPDQTFTTKQPAITGAATEIKGATATLNGTVLAEGEAVSECKFEYGAGLGYGKTAPCLGAIPTDEGEHPVTASLTHLTPDAPVHFRLVINRGNGPIRGPDASFETQATVVTGAASAIAPPTASVEGAVNPEGIALSECVFEYGRTTTGNVLNHRSVPFEASVPCAESPASIGTGTGPVAVHADLSGLTFGVVYHYRLVATNADGTSAGEDGSFKTSGATIEAERARSVGLTEATLGATINPNGSATTYRLEYGTTASYGTSTEEASIGAEELDQPVGNTLEGLAPATTYHWRIVATNSVGVSEGPDRTFTTYASPAAPETGCPNQVFRTGVGANLPDCRAYEQATPTDKNGGNVARDINRVQASSAGDRITYVLTGGLPSTGGSALLPTYVASREAGAWGSNGLQPLAEPGGLAVSMGWNEEITASATSINRHGIYLGDTAARTFQLAFPAPSPRSPFLAGFASDPSHLIFDTTAPLAPGAIAGKANVYDLDHGDLSLAGRIPAAPATSCDDAGSPACIPAPAGSFAGPYDWEHANTTQGGVEDQYYTQNTISADGSKVFFTAAGSGQLYVREGGSRTTQVSASQASTPDPNGPKPAAFMAATPSGSKVFFTSCEKLTDDSTAVSSAADTCATLTQGRDLYSYDTASGDLTDLTVDSHVGDPQRAGVIGVLGTSADGSYVYFAANGVLAPGASAGDCAGGDGSCNLYVSHAGTVTFIAPVGSSDVNDWLPGTFDRTHGGVKEARVAANGTLLFGSTRNLTGYESTQAITGVAQSSCGSGCLELYRYAPTGDLTCVSCDPTGAAPVNSARLESIGAAYGTGPQTQFLTRNISSDGNRIFFDSPDSLVPADTNRVVDPYEWEAEGAGSCHSANTDGGCLYLLSSGTRPDPSYLGDVSTSGDDAFIFTSQPLVPSDRDELVDVYDARVGGGLAAQHPSEAPACLGEACKGASTSAPSGSSPGSASFNGPGNQAGKPVKRCQKHAKKKCKKAKKQHKKAKPKKSRGAHTNRGGSK
jgi:hypothetical protein